MQAGWIKASMGRRLRSPAAELAGQRRIRFGALMLGLAFLVLATQLTAVVLDGRAAEGTSNRSQLGQGHRADIVDRNGVILATNAQTHSLYAHPHEMSGHDVERILREFAVIFPDMDIDRVGAQLNPKRKFAWIRSRISPRQMQAVNEIGPGTHFGNGRPDLSTVSGIPCSAEEVGLSVNGGNRGVEVWRGLALCGMRGERHWHPLTRLQGLSRNPRDESAST